MRVSRRFREFDRNGCTLYLPLYKYGANLSVLPDLSGAQNHVTTITNAVCNPPAMLQQTELVTNGTFASDLSGWTYGNEWSQAGGKASKAATTAQDLEQNIGAVAGATYFLRYDAVRTAGTITPQIGGVNGGAQSASYSGGEFITASTTGNLKFQANAAFAGTIDNVSVYKVTGYQGAGFVFNGSNTSMTVPTNTNLNILAGVISVVLWITPFQYGVNRRLLAKTNASSQGYYCTWTAAQGFSASVYDGTGTRKDSTATAAARTGVATHVAFTTDNSNLYTYEMGVRANPVACVGNNASANNLFLGRAGDSASLFFQGNIHEAILAQRAWSQEEVKSHFEITRHRYGV